MGYTTLRECLDDLDRAGHLVRISQPIDAHLEAAEIQRRVYRAGGPAIYFAQVKDCRFPMVSNLFGTIERTRYIFRDSLEAIRRLIELKTDPHRFWKNPFRYLGVGRTALLMRPRKCQDGPVLDNKTTIENLPQLKSWPDDGGAFITLGQVYTEDVEHPGMNRSNLGMYRVQLSGGQYEKNQEVGLHYQIHRGIGVHHAAAIRRGVPLRVNVFVGGPPAMSMAAVMPLPEGISEVTFAGALGGRRVPMICREGQLPMYAQADFCITGTIDDQRQLPEGPFGDHLGYYSLAHDFPVLRVEQVYHRDDAIWPFTVVGRPPQEDSSFGQFIHEIFGPLLPTVIPGIHAVHAVDAAGVHPLLLAIGSERYTPYTENQRPQELLTQANALLGQGQLSLAKYLILSNHQDRPKLELDDVSEVFRHMLERVDFERDLHFQTRTTIDTLDYSGSSLNEGSKLVIATVGPPRRHLPIELNASLRLPEGFKNPRLCMPGVLAIEGPPHSSHADAAEDAMERFASFFEKGNPINHFPLLVVVDDSEMTSRTLNNFLWVTFTRSDPAADIYGIESFVQQKHWGCRGSIIIDARRKPHHAPPLVEDPEITRRVDSLATPGGPLHGII